MATRIKKDDEVIVISGRDKGARGRVLKVLRDQDKVIVENVGRVKKHQKPNQQNPQGGIIEKDLPIVPLVVGILFREQRRAVAAGIKTRVRAAQVQLLNVGQEVPKRRVLELLAVQYD